MNYLVIDNFSKNDAYQFLDDNVDIDIVFNIKKFEFATWSQYLKLDMVADLFGPLLSLERFVVTVVDIDHLKITNTHAISYSINLRQNFCNFELIYYFQLYNWLSDLYVLEETSNRNHRVIFSEMRNVSINNVNQLTVKNDYPHLGFYLAVDSHVFEPEDSSYVLITSPKLCSSCIYYSGQSYLPCAVNIVGIPEMKKKDFECSDYQFKYGPI